MKSLFQAFLISVLLVGPAGVSMAKEVEAGLSDQIDSYLGGLVESGFSGAVLVARDGEILHHEGYGLADDADHVPVTAETAFGFGSITKQFTAAAILHLESRGQLSTGDRISNHLDGVPADKQEITIHQLLTHSAGLQNNVFDSDLQDISRDEAISRILGRGLDFRPGTRARYSDDAFKLLAAIVEVTSGRSWQSYLHTQIFQPAGMEDTGFFNERLWDTRPVATGYASGRDQGSPSEWPGPYWPLIGAGGVVTTVGDMYRWWEALWDGRVLSPAAIDQLITPHESIGGRASFGYGWTIVETEDRGTFVEAGGAGSSHNAYFHSSLNDDVVVIVASNRIDESLLSRLGLIELQETLYAGQVGDALVESIAGGDFGTPPEFAQPDARPRLRPTSLGYGVAGGVLMVLLVAAVIMGRRTLRRSRVHLPNETTP